MLIFPDTEELLEIKEYSFLVRTGTLLDDILPGDLLSLNESFFPITQVGEIAQKNLIEIGHITLKFGMPATSGMPGTIYLESDQVPDVNSGTVLRILKAPK